MQNMLLSENQCIAYVSIAIVFCQNQHKSTSKASRLFTKKVNDYLT